VRGRSCAVPGVLALCLALLAAPRLAGEVIISEFAAAPQRAVADEDGEREDWIELHNPDPAPADLGGWFLTDDPDRLDKWQFLPTQLDPGAFLVVFASEKDRRLPGHPLHTNFKLAAAGEYLALVRPDGRSVVTQFAPKYPPQAEGVSYGIPMSSAEVELVPRGSVGRWVVPRDDTFGEVWRLPEFDDSGWLMGTTGLGFASAQEPVLVPVADSVEDWSPSGEQGYRGWVYGYYDRSQDKVPGYGVGDFIPFPRAEAVHGPENFWSGAQYRWPSATAPWDRLARTEGHPNGAASGGEHWVIRRWTSNVAGDLQVRWRLAKAVTGGTGVTGRLFHNGIQRSYLTVAGNDTAGATRAVLVPGVAVGDVIDLALTPTGVGGATDDRSDDAQFMMTILAPGTLHRFIGTDVSAAMQGVNASLYLRLPFVLPDVEKLTRPVLKLRYNDGFVAWLNGSEVARRNAPGRSDDEAEPDATLDWRSSATVTRSVAETVELETLDLSAYADLLRPGINALCLQGLNAAATNDDFLLEPELTAVRRTLDPEQHGYFATPTPGAANGAATETIGPGLSEVGHAPGEPGGADDVLVTARVTPTLRPLGGVVLRYQAMYRAEVSVTMRDDGTFGDATAGDGVYTGVIPAGTARAGEMLRYAVAAADQEGFETREPAFLDPLNSPQYFGTVVTNPALAASRLPVLHWFIERPGAADSDTPARCAICFAGQFLDNVAATIHGQSSRGFPKKSYDFDLNPGHKLRWSPDAPGVDDFNLLSTWADKSHLRNVLAYETYRDAGAPGHFAFPVRVEQNGAFFSVANFVENGDDNFLERLGLDREGALYKMYNSAEGVSSSEKKTRKSEGTGDLQALITGMSQGTATARQAYLYDNLDVPEIVDFLAARMITADVDCCHKNYYLYRDTRGSGEWQAMPWDVDLSFGRVWTCGTPCLAYYDETMYTNQAIALGTGNRIFTPFYDTAATRQMVLRRLRTLMDTLLQPPGTPATNDLYRLRSLTLRDQIAPDAARDLAKWGTWGRRESITQAVDRIRNEFLPGRRAFLFRTQSVTNRGEIPLAQPADARVTFGALEFRPASGVPDGEWLSLRNDNAFAVDVSGWRIAGDVQFTFKGGTVIPVRSDLYVSPDVKAFRGRTASPKGGERRFVVGPLAGNLPARGGTLRLEDASGRVVATRDFAGDPSPAQRYLRISELMYHPAPGFGGASDVGDCEYLELVNTGPEVLDLGGVAFTAGVQFSFNSGTNRSLVPGGRVLVVKNLEAFTACFGSGLPVAGEFSGSLDNTGERLRLVDAFGEEILDFTYNDAWQPAADGGGAALTVVDELAPWQAWDNPTQWTAAVPTPGTLAGRRAVLEPLSPGTRLRLVGTVGETWEIQRSADLDRWEALATVKISAGGSADFADPTPLAAHAYYRACRR